MAITYNNKATNISTSGTPVSFNYTVGSGSNRLLVAIMCGRTSGSLSSMTYNGVSMTLAKRQSNADGESVEIWYLVNPASGTNSLQYAKSSSGDDWRAYVSDWAGVKQTSPVNITAGSNANAGNGSTSITPTADNCLIVAGLTSEDGGAPGTGSGETTLYNTDEGAWSTGSSYVIQTTAGAQTMDYTGQDDYNAVAAVAFEAYPSNVAPGAPTLETADNTETTDTTPSLDFNSVDANGDDVVYQVQIDDDSGFGSTAVDADGSASSTGFSNVDTPADTSPFNSGDTVRYTVQSALGLGTYYWRVRAKDPSGSNTWGNWSETRKIHIYDTTKEMSISAVSSIPTGKTHPYSDGALAATSTEYTNVSSDNATRVSKTGASTTYPYFLYKYDLGDNPFTVNANVQVDKESTAETVQIASDSQYDSNGNNSTRSVSFTVASNTNRVLLVYVAVDDNTAVLSITYNSVSLTQIGAYGDSNGRIEAWRLVAPATGANTLQVNMNAACYFAFSAVDVYGANQTNPVNVYNGGTKGSVSNFTSSVTTTVNNCLLIDGFNYSGSSRTWTQDSGQTVLWGTNGYGFHAHWGSSESKATAGSESMGWTVDFVSYNVAHIIVAVAPAVIDPEIDLDLWNDTTSSWEALDTETAPTANTDFTLTGSKSTGYADYTDANGFIIARVAAKYLPSVTLRVDLLEIAAAASVVTKTHTTSAYTFITDTLTHTTGSLLQAVTSKSHTTDSLLQKAATKAHTTDSYFSGANTLLHTTGSLLQKAASLTHTTDAYTRLLQETTHTTDALKQIVGTQAHTTDALKKAVDITLTHTTDALALLSGTKSHSGDALLQKPTDTTHTADSKVVKFHYGQWSETWDWTVSAPVIKHYTDALLQTINSKTHTTDALAQKAAEKSHTGDSLVKKGTTQTHTSDSLLKKALSLTHTTNALLKKAATQLHTTDSLLREAFEKSHTTDSYLQTATTQSHITDTLLLKEQSKVHTTDSLLQSIFSASHTTDTLMKVASVLAHTGDALLRKAANLLHTTDTFLKKAFESTHTADSLLQKATETTHTADANLQRFGLQIHYTDADLQGSVTPTHDTDALFKKSAEQSHSTDALKNTTTEPNHTTDTLKKKAGTIGHSADALKYIVVSKTHLTDSLIRRGQVADHTTDAVKYGQASRDHDTDALKYIVQTTTHNTDSYKYTVPMVSHNTDTYASRTQEASHTTDTYKVKTYRKTHSTDALILKNVSRRKRTHLSYKSHRARMKIRSVKTNLRSKSNTVKLKISNKGI